MDEQEAFVIPSPGPLQKGPGDFGALERDAKVGLNTSWTVLSVGGLAEVSLSGLRIEACILPSPVKCVEEIHAEDRLHSLRIHGNSF